MASKENSNNINSANARNTTNNNYNTVYKAPNIPEEQINPTIVRDELLKCFESANREFSKTMNLQEQQKTTQQQPLLQAQKDSNNNNNPQQNEEQRLKQQVRQFVTNVFQNCGVDFENPKKEGIVMAIEECKKNAEAMMGPGGRDIIEHHYNEMMKLVNRL